MASDGCPRLILSTWLLLLDGELLLLLSLVCDGTTTDGMIVTGVIISSDPKVLV